MKDTIPVWVKVVRRLFKIYTPFLCAVKNIKPNCPKCGR